MKKLLIATLIATLSFNASAAEQDGKLSCDTLAEVTEMIMSARQLGVPLDDVLKIDKGNIPGFRFFTLEAYKFQIYESELMKKVTADKYSNMWLVRCLEHDLSK